MVAPAQTDTLFDPEQPDKRPDWQLARLTDPQTSHDAATSLKAVELTKVRQSLLDLLRSVECGMTDTEIARYYHGPSASPSGLRTRRAELVDGGLVEDSGRRERLPSGRMAIVWQAVSAAEVER